MYTNICIQILQNIQEETEWVLYSKDSRDIVIMYVCNLNNIPVENNHKQIMQKKIEKECKNKAFTIIHFLGQYSPG